MTERGTEDVDWSLCTFAGNRLHQRRSWLALPFRDKLAAIEEMGAVAEMFLVQRRARGLPVSTASGRPSPPQQQ